MRRLLTAVSSRFARKAGRFSPGARIEAMESRTLLSVTPLTSPPSSTPVSMPFTSTTATIDGTVFIDNNNNGILDIADTRVPFVEVYVDRDNNGIADLTVDEVVQADQDGDFRLSVPAGTWHVLPVFFGFDILEPTSPGLLPITVSAGDQFVGANFAFLNPGSVSGTVFGDTNGNGIQDAGEVGVAGKTVYADVNNDGVPDTGDLTALTDSSGNYTITGFNTGTFTIRLDVPPGGHQTAPSSGVYHDAIVAGQTATGNNFGLTGPDLAIQMLTAPPTQIVGGTKQKPLVVTITNVGSSAISNLVGVSLFASLDNTVDSSDWAVGGLLGRKTKLKPGQSKTLRVPLQPSQQVPTAAYKILAQVISSVPDENAANDVAVPGVTTTIVKPVVDLSVAYGSQPALVMDYATPTSVGVILTNHGNVEFSGSVRITVYTSVDGTLQNARPIGRSRIIKARLLPNQSRGFIVPVVFTGQRKGVFFILTTAQSVDDLSDNNSANNTVVSTFPSDIR